MARATCVLVGGGLAAARAAEALRGADDRAEILLVSEEQHAPYERPDLSKGYLAGKKSRADLDPLDERWYADHDVELLLGSPATRLDAGARRVRLADGRSLTYDRLLLATGSTLRRLGVGGAQLEGVHYLRTLEDSQALKSVLDAGGPLVVVGGGWIGLEVAAVAREHGVHVTLLEAAPTPLERVVGPQLGRWFAELHRGHGVDLRTGTSVAEIRGTRRVEEVVTDSGKVLPAAAVLVGVGVGPRTELAVGAGLEVDAGVVADGRLRTSDPYVWAAGDVASAENDWAGRRLRVEHWANAQDQGEHAGRSMAGSGERWNRPPFFFSDQYDVGLEYRGWADPATAELVVRGRPSQGPFVAFWLKDGAVHAALHVNSWDDGDALKALVTQKAVIAPEKLADPGQELASLVPTTAPGPA
jgi:3-phenylpropionate/trans-cinnamate dioxygenase ferredoxin reductase component